MNRSVHLEFACQARKSRMLAICPKSQMDLTYRLANTLDMTTPSKSQSPNQQRKTTLRVFYVFVFLAIGTFTFAVRSSHASQEALIALGIVLAGGGIWSFLRFLKVADTHQRLINHEATSFAFVASLLLTLVIGLLQRFGFLSGASLLIPALMVSLWSIGLVLFSWRYQE